MDKEYVMHIAQTIKEQLIGLAPMPVLMSWGICRVCSHHLQRAACTSYQSKRTVTRRIRLLLHLMGQIIMRYIC